MATADSRPIPHGLLPILGHQLEVVKSAKRGPSLSQLSVAACYAQGKRAAPPTPTHAVHFIATLLERVARKLGRQPGSYTHFVTTLTSGRD